MNDASHIRLLQRWINVHGNRPIDSHLRPRRLLPDQHIELCDPHLARRAALCRGALAQ